MKAKIHLRIGKSTSGKYVAEANARPNHSPLRDNRKRDLPTVAFAIMLDIPDAAFKRAEQVIAEVRIPEEDLQIAAEVKDR